MSLVVFDNPSNSCEMPMTQLNVKPVRKKSGRYQDRYLTIPNVISIVRLIGAIGLIFVALAGHPLVFMVSFFILHLSDWVDGRIARWLDQHSAFGARLDSASDSVLYACLLIGCVILNSEMMLAEAPWILLAMASYAMTTGYGLWKYGKVPSYHTFAAKKTQWLVLAGGACVLMNWSPIPLRIAAVATALTNIEATAMSVLLKNWHSDILSIIDLLPSRRRKARRRMKWARDN